MGKLPKYCCVWSKILHLRIFSMGCWHFLVSLHFLVQNMLVLLKKNSHCIYHNPIMIVLVLSTFKIIVQGNKYYPFEWFLLYLEELFIFITKTWVTSYSKVINYYIQEFWVFYSDYFSKAWKICLRFAWNWRLFIFKQTVVHVRLQ